MFLLALLVFAVACKQGLANHDPRCTGDRACVAAERVSDNEFVLRCVRNDLDVPIKTAVTWLKNDQVYEADRTRVRLRHDNELVFTELLVSDEANWTCSDGRQSPDYRLFARKVNVTQEFTSLNFTIGDNFTIPCNIEVGVNTAQTTYIITIHREVIFHSRDNISEPVIQYTNSAGQGPLATSTINSTLYTFYNANFTLDVVNFSIPYPEEVRGHGVKYFCNFYTIASGTTIMADTTTAVIPGFRPPVITKNLSDITIISLGSTRTFSVTVDSHPSPSYFWWNIDDKTITENSSNYVIGGPTPNGDSTTYNLTILNINEEQYGNLMFKVKLAKSFASTRTLLIGPPRLRSLELRNGCRDIKYGEGTLMFDLMLNNHYPSLSLHSHSLRVQLEFIWTSVTEKLRRQNTTSITTVVDVAPDSLGTDWTGERRISLAVDRSQAVPSHVARSIRNQAARFRVQVRVVLNGTTASDWSPECHSPIYQTCLESSMAEINLRLKFSAKDSQCALYPASKVKTAIQNIFDKMFNCDNITVSYTEQYHCDQLTMTGIFRASVTAYRARERVKDFYSLLHNEGVSLFNGSVTVTEEENPPVFDDMTIVYPIVSVLLLILVVIVFILVIGISRKKCTSKSSDVESKGDDGEGRGSPHGSERSQNHYVEEASLSCRSPMSITSSESSVFENSQQISSRGILRPPEGDSVSAIVTERENTTTGNTQQSRDVQRATGSRDQPALGHITMSEQDVVKMTRALQSRAESSMLGDEISLNYFDRRQAYTDSPAFFDSRGTPSSGYQSQNSGHIFTRSRKRHHTDNPTTATNMSLVQVDGREYLMLHGTDLRDDRRPTNSTSSSFMGTPRLIRVQHIPSRSREEGEEEEEGAKREPDIRSREHLRLQLQQEEVGHLRTVVSHKVSYPSNYSCSQRRYSDPSPLSASPQPTATWVLDQNRQYHRQDTENSGEQDTSIL